MSGYDKYRQKGLGGHLMGFKGFNLQASQRGNMLKSECFDACTLRRMNMPISCRMDFIPAGFYKVKPDGFGKVKTLRLNAGQTW